MMVTRRHFVGTIAAATSLAAMGLRAQTRSITFVGWSPEEAASRPTIAALFDGYRTSTGNKLDVIGFPWAQMQQNVLLRMRSGQPLDIVQLAERWLPQFGATGRLADMNQVFGKAQLQKQISPGVLALGEYRGKQLGLPWTAGSIGMVANAKVLHDAGVSDVPKSVEAFVGALRSIKKANPESVPYAMCSKNNNTLSPDFQVWLWTFGGRLFDEKGKVAVNSPASVRALTFMSDLIKEGLAAKDIDRPDARRMFAQHQSGFYNDAPLARGFARSNSGQGDKFDSFVIAMPTPVMRAADTPRSLAWGHLLTIFGDGKTPIDAQSAQAKLLAYLVLNDDAQLHYYRDIGLFPVTNSALAKLASDPYVSTWSKSARTALKDETSYWGNAAELTTIVGEEVQAALLAQKSPTAAIESMAKRLEAGTAGTMRL
ncbi:extracellular solute-binding protein [Paraburkholderia agricolaris]|uniref:extracellular solute-binding protein n=1 Tax=Paraburkholderia agricolaris TaxID=2152888 RepID=UPI0038B7DCC9